MARGSILLAHGNADCQLIYAGFLQFSGYDVVVVDTVDEALRQLAGAHYDAVIADLYLVSAAAGDDCLVRQMRLARYSAHVPTVVLTAWATEGHRDLAREAGADRFLEMPTTPRALLAVIDELLEHTQFSGIPAPPTPPFDLQNRPIPTDL